MSASSSYSAPRSSNSSPREASGETPPPPSASSSSDGGPSPLVIGTRFVKQYYQVLTSDTPEQIVKFYQPSSLQSTGTSSNPSEASGAKTAEAAADRFPASVGLRRFEFCHGAIDAQVTGNSGILVVVTGQVIYTTKTSEEDEHGNDDDDDEVERCQAFCHTFVLNPISTSQGKRSFYVQNDILRFLDEKLTTTSTISHHESMEDNHVDEVDAAEKDVSNGTTISAAEGDVSPGGGVEETKEIVLDEDDGEVSPVADLEENETLPAETEETEVQEMVGTEQAKEENFGAAATDDAAEISKSTSKLSSWASLAAKPPAPSTPSRKVPAASSASPAANNKASNSEQMPASTATAASTAPSPIASKGKTPASVKPVHTPISKRDPDFTLVVKNIASKTNEPDVVNMFETFAKDTDTAIVSITVAANKGIAFLDFNAAAPVVAIVEQHKQEAFKLHGKTLDIFQKSSERVRKFGPGGRGGGGGPGGRQHRGGGGRSGRGGR
ncbi:hypothetical protein MPSEU_001058800 [Mayamaea pseudoterrestris]|nr:hypothetical protein MPSEU_001058800 [Mayamaea pseudoterrestris]